MNNNYTIITRDVCKTFMSPPLMPLNNGKGHNSHESVINCPDVLKTELKLDIYRIYQYTILQIIVCDLLKDSNRN